MKNSSKSEYVGAEYEFNFIPALSLTPEERKAVVCTVEGDDGEECVKIFYGPDAMEKAREQVELWVQWHGHTLDGIDVYEATPLLVETEIKIGKPR